MAMLIHTSPDLCADGSQSQQIACIQSPQKALASSIIKTNLVIWFHWPFCVFLFCFPIIFTQSVRLPQVFLFHPWPFLTSEQRQAVTMHQPLLAQGLSSGRVKWCSAGLAGCMEGEPYLAGREVLECSMRTAGNIKRFR